MNYVQAEEMVLRKGFTTQQLLTTLQEYEMLSVIHRDTDGHIYFDE